MRRRIAAATAGLFLGCGALTAQAVPAGVSAIVLPVQSVVPDAGGTWVGGAASAQSSIDLLNAEIEFAIAEEAGAAGWTLAPAVEARLARNPTIGVDPRRLAYQGLLAPPDPRARLYEPLHTQLRRIAALFGARHVVLPLAVSYRESRAVLRLALIDVRRSAVLWQGEIEGAEAEASSPHALTTLALRVADHLASSGR